MPERSKYSENQFLAATRDSYVLTSEVIADCKTRIAFAVTQDARFTDLNNEFISTSAAWDAAETVSTNCEASLRGATLSLDDKLLSLTRKPDADTNSLIETWDTIIRAAVAYQGPTYTILLPDGRETISRGGIESQIDAIRDFGVRLSQQTTKPTLVALGTTVTAFANATRSLRTLQLMCKNRLEDSRVDLEALRVLNCQVIFAVVGMGMIVWRSMPERVDELFSVSLLRGSVLAAPGAPIDTTVVVLTRTVSTTAMPAHGTRLEVYRQAPGGAPELIAIGEPGQLSLVIENLYVFTEGVTYQVWLQARNSRGTSAPGPTREWLEE